MKMKMKMKGLIVLLTLGTTVASLNVFALGDNNVTLSAQCHHIIRLVDENLELTGVVIDKIIEEFDATEGLDTCDVLVLQDDVENVGPGGKLGDPLNATKNLTHICESDVQGGDGSGPFY